jgi:drug/metabolite transporter (DMT)-like permease
MIHRATRTEWLIFLALGFFWGSSYLFIKLAVDDFGTFTLVALRLLFGAGLLWTVVFLSRVELPRQPMVYGHLVVMSAINIAIPFALITWAERSVDSSIAAILTAAVPLFVIVLAPLFLPDEPIRVNGLAGLAVGFVGVVILTGRDLSGSGGELVGAMALIGAALSYACGAIYARRNVRGLRPMVPAVLQVSFAFLIMTAMAFLFEHPLDSTPDAQAIFSIVWLGLLGSGLAYLCFFRLLGPWGATRLTMVSYVIPVVGILLGFIVLNETIDGRVLFGTAMILTGIGLVNSRHGRRRLFGGRPPVERTEASSEATEPA